MNKLKEYNDGVIRIRKDKNYFDVFARNFDETGNDMTEYIRLAHCFIAKNELGFSLQFYHNEIKKDFAKVYYNYFAKMLKDGTFWYNIKTLLDNRNESDSITSINWHDKYKDTKLGMIYNYVYNTMIRNYEMSKNNSNVGITHKQYLYQTDSHVYMVF